MYRAVTRAALDNRVPLDDEIAAANLARMGSIDYQFSPDGEVKVIISENDATNRLRDAEVDSAVSAIAAHREVRAILVPLQQQIASQASIVMVGRDIGTEVLQDAELKIYLTASAEERAHRRHEENVKLGFDGTYDEILEAIRRRDNLDSNRAASPLRPADDSILLDSDNKTVEQVVDEITELADSRR